GRARRSSLRSFCWRPRGQASRLRSHSHAGGEIVPILLVAAYRVVGGLALGEPLLEFLGAGAPGRIGEGFMLLLHCVDLRHARPIALDAALIGPAQSLAGERVGHPGNPFAGGLTAKLADLNRTRTPTPGLCRSWLLWHVRTVISGSRYEIPRLYLGSVVQTAGRGRNGQPFRRDRRGSHPCQLGDHTHVMAKVGRYHGHCKGGAIARLSERPAAGGRPHT